MSLLSGVSAAVTSFNTEGRAALVQFNVDFSLLRCDAPNEFRPIGTAMSLWRRTTAESGTFHRTACRLGLLFHDLLPDNILLRRAYGERAAEIASDIRANPQGSRAHGPFQDYVGADCSSIWAAATSKVSAAIAVHLLGCLLAKLWDANDAIPIWVELVKERKIHINTAAEANIINPNSVAIAQMDIGRQELAAWDASCRAWLRRANESKKWAHHQFSLIVNNLSLPVCSGGTTYEQVTNTWIRSMETVEKLLKGQPHEAYDRLLLDAISSWHLYPDLLVLQDRATRVHFHDEKFSASATLTLGTEYRRQGNWTADDGLTRWSLALSHQKYYGGPVVAKSDANLSRVTIQELWIVALGTMFRMWKIRLSEFDHALQWFCHLSPITEPTSHCGIRLSWLRRFCEAAKQVLQSDDGEEKRAKDLLRHGWRRDSNFLGDLSWSTPFFGLRIPSVASALSQAKPIECGMQYLRAEMNLANVNPYSAFIHVTVRMNSEDDAGYNYNEIATIAPVATDDKYHPPQHIRWIWIERKARNNLRDIVSEGWGELHHRCSQVEAMGEKCFIRPSCNDVPKGDAGLKFSLRTSVVNPFDQEVGPTFERSPHTPQKYADSRSQGFAIWQSTEANIPSPGLEQPMPWDDSSEWLKNKSYYGNIQKYLLTVYIGRLSFQNTLKRRAPWEHHIVQREAENLELINSADDTQYLIIAAQPVMPHELTSSLEILDLASLLYSKIPSATISLKVMNIKLLDSKWIPQCLERALRPEFQVSQQHRPELRPHRPLVAEAWANMGRAETFGCIAMFESGKFNLDQDTLQEVIALCSEDSIFVSGVLLSDPAKISSENNIQHIVGNVGHIGMVLMVSPEAPRIRPLADEVGQVSHAQYDGARDDHFGGTSLHLSFTEWKVPLDWNSTGQIDNEIFLLESVVTVRDRGEFVADLDVLDLERNEFDVADFQCSCGPGSTLLGSRASEFSDFISLDSWDELLDPPSEGAGIFRSHGNWVARLACASILAQKGLSSAMVVIDGRHLCWKCFLNNYSYPEPRIPAFIID
ncbi:hypothetical protein MKZ38_002426 [Zalerion maritima]|uniref:Uncharacterized protein n=1 Tax=Zalerion maritima TaxID=339359 RepID=A0AAD5WQV2_9PEZI|nr:hypothetical protein MKZ38_002426 [Zalerion maritima]